MKYLKQDACREKAENNPHDFIPITGWPVFSPGCYAFVYQIERFLKYMARKARNLFSTHERN